ncbi:hypothetical protein Lser_V15G36250 [Lactuca serriola]
MVMTRTGPSFQEVALRVGSCNLKADLDLGKFDPTLHIMIEFLKSHPIHKPLTKSIKFPLSIIHTAYSSAIYDSDEEYIEFDINKDNTIKLWKAEFLEAIGLPERKEKKTFYEPTNEELFDVLDQMGYLPPRLEMTPDFKKGKLPGIWHFLVHIIVRCLTGKVGGTSTLSRAFLVLLFGIYTGKEVDSGTIIWKDFAGCVFPRKKEIPCARFWALALQKVYTKLDVSLPEGEEMFTTGTVSRYAIPDQAEFGKVARLPEAMLQYIEKNSEVLIRHIKETDPLETGHPIQSSQPVRPTEGHTSSPARKKQIALNVKKTTGLGTKRKCETLPAPQAKRPTIGSQSSTSHVSLSSEEDDVSQKNGDIAHTPPPSSQKQTPGIHSHINLEATETSPSFHTTRLEKNLWGSPGHNTKDQGSQGRVFEPMLKSSSIPGKESCSMAHRPLQTGFFGISIGEAEVRASESESVRQARDEQERQKREEILRAEQERFSQIYYNNIYLYEQMLREQKIRDEMEKEESKKVKAVKHAEYRKKRKEVLMENKRKEEELKAKMQREQEEREKTEALREAEAKKEEERKELVRMLREEQQKREEEEWAQTSAKLLEQAMSLEPSTKTGMESAQDMEKDFVFTADDGLIQDSDSNSIMETLKPSKSTIFLATSETESQEAPKGETKTFPTTTVETSKPRRRTKWKKKKKSKYISRVEFNSLNQKLSQVLEVVNKIPPSKEKFVTKEEFGEMQKIVTSLAQSVPNLETREKMLRESFVKSTADALKKMEQKRTNDTFKYLDRMDDMLKMVKEIQQSFDDLTNTMGHQHGDEIVRLNEQLCDYRNKNIILQAVLVKVIQSAQQLLRPCNIRFDEILFAIQKVQNSVDVLPKTLSNDELSKQVPQSFQKVFDLIENLKGSRFVDEAGEDENVLITETSPSPEIDVVSKPQSPPPPLKTTIPPTECEIHESPKIPSPPTSFVMPPAQIVPEFPETPKAPINDKGKMPLEISELSLMKTFPVCEKEMKQQVKEHTLTLWVDDIKQLRDDELVPKQTTAPPSSDEYQWDIPMSPNAQYYSVFQPLHPHLSREMQIPIEMNRLEEFFKAHAQPPKDVWSLRRIIRVLGYKKRSFQKEEYFGFEVVRSDNKKYFFSEADFPNLNPNDLYVIAKHFQTKLLTHQPSRFPFLQIQRFLRSLTYDLGSIDAERFDSFVDNPPGEMNQELEGIENRHRGPTEDPELGIIFSNEKGSPRLFFRLKQKHLCKTEFLEKMINLTLRSNASAALKVKIIEELEWWVAVRKWIKRVKSLVTNKI